MRRIAPLLGCIVALACSGGSLQSTTLDSQLVSQLDANGVKCLPHTPPPFAACDGLDGGATCTFTDDGRTVTGACHLTGTGRFVCAAGEDDDEAQGPGAAAIAACAGLDAGATCTFPEHETMTTRDGGDDDDQGICTQFPADGGDVLACTETRPHRDGERQGPHGGPLGAAFDACSGQAAGTACTFRWKDHGLAGSCTATPSGALVCAPACHQ